MTCGGGHFLVLKSELPCILLVPVSVQIGSDRVTCAKRKRVCLCSFSFLGFLCVYVIIFVKTHKREQTLMLALKINAPLLLISRSRFPPLHLD